MYDCSMRLDKPSKKFHLVFSVDIVSVVPEEELRADDVIIGVAGAPFTNLEQAQGVANALREEITRYVHRADVSRRVGEMLEQRYPWGYRSEDKEP